MMRRSVTAISVIQRLNQACRNEMTNSAPNAVAVNEIKPIAHAAGRFQATSTMPSTRNRIACQYTIQCKWPRMMMRSPG